MMSIRIQMHAPAGTARVVLSGASFGRVSCYTSDIPQCQIVKFTDSELVVRNTAEDGDGAPGQFGLDVDLLVDPFSSGAIGGQTTGAATLAVQYDGSWQSLGTEQAETVLFQWIGLLENLPAKVEKQGELVHA